MSRLVLVYPAFERFITPALQRGIAVAVAVHHEHPARRKWQIQRPDENIVLAVKRIVAGIVAGHRKILVDGRTGIAHCFGDADKIGPALAADHGQF